MTNPTTRRAVLAGIATAPIAGIPAAALVGPAPIAEASEIGTMVARGTELRINERLHLHVLAFRKDAFAGPPTAPDIGVPVGTA